MIPEAGKRFSGSAEAVPGRTARASNPAQHKLPGRAMPPRTHAHTDVRGRPGQIVPVASGPSGCLAFPCRHPGAVPLRATTRRRPPGGLQCDPGGSISGAEVGAFSMPVATFACHPTQASRLRRSTGPAQPLILCPQYGLTVAVAFQLPTTTRPSRPQCRENPSDSSSGRAQSALESGPQYP